MNVAADPTPQQQQVIQPQALQPQVQGGTQLKVQEQPTTLQQSNTSPSPLKATSTPTTQQQQLTFEQAQLGGDLAKVAQAKGLSLQNLSSQDLNQLLAPIVANPSIPRASVR